MRFLPLVYSTISLLSLASAWDCDERCPENEFRLCKEGNRFLQEDTSMLEDNLSREGEPKDLFGEQDITPVLGTSNLRGSVSFPQEDSHRQLVTSNYTYFQLKMYWEVGYCVSSLVALLILIYFTQCPDVPVTECELLG